MSANHDGGATRFTRGKRMACPHCGGEVSVGITVELEGDLTPITVGATPPGLPGQMEAPSSPEGDREVLEQAEASGLLKAFTEAQLGGRPAEQLPKDMGSLFLMFFKKATPKNVPKVCLDYFIREFSPARIEVWGAEGVAAILADRRIKAFVPYRLVRGQQIKSIGTGGSKARMDIDEGRFFEWVRTKHGYVPAGKGGFFSAMQQKSRGDFARLVQ
jgi:hypothetical protein